MGMADVVWRCAGMTALWDRETCLPVPKRRHVAALHIGAGARWGWAMVGNGFLAEYGIDLEKIIRAHSALGWEGRGYWGLWG